MTLDPGGFELLTFDCYGTLIDWERGIADALRSACAPHGIEATDEELLAHFADVEHRVQAGSFLPYREVLKRTLVGVSEALGFQATDAECSTFAHSVGEWPAFADTVEALTRLSGRYKMGVVSNVDDDLFADSAKRLGVPFDMVVTAEQVGSYKPAPGHFHEALRRSGTRKAQMLHVAQSLFHDIAPAGALGLTTLWINRRTGQPGSGATPPSDARPDAEVPDMKSAAELLLDQ